MAKTKEELNELKKEYETLTAKLSELTEDEFNNVVGGATGDWETITPSGIDAKNQGNYNIYYGNIPLDSDEKLKS